MNNIIWGSQISSHILAPFFALKDINFDEGNILYHRDPSKEKKKTIRMPKAEARVREYRNPVCSLGRVYCSSDTYPYFRTYPPGMHQLQISHFYREKHYFYSRQTIFSSLLWRKSASKEYPRIVNDVKTTLEFFLLPYLALTLVCR